MTKFKVAAIQAFSMLADLKRILATATNAITDLSLAVARGKQIRPGTNLIKNRRQQFHKPFVDTVNMDI